MPRSIGRLVVLEGPDGVGKTTLSEELVRALGAEAVRYSFPGNEPRSLGAWVYQLHHQHAEGMLRVTPLALQGLHVAAHLDVIEARIIPSLQNGLTVVLDRFWWSTWVYGRVMGVPKSQLDALLKPERTLWADYTPHVLLRLRRVVPNPTADRAKLDALYDELGAAESDRYRITEIDTSQSLTRTVEQALHAIRASSTPSSRKRQSELAFRPSAAERPSAPTVFARMAPAVSTHVFDTYWRFAVERQSIYMRRLRRTPPPWTDDPVLRAHKFTNTYRASDRISQFLIRHVIYSRTTTEKNLLLRVLLFKFFNKIETWRLLEKAFGEITERTFDYERADKLLTKAQESGQRLYSAAYIMPSGSHSFPNVNKKHRMHLMLLKRMTSDSTVSAVLGAKSLQHMFDVLRAFPTIGDFLAYQYAIDLNYSEFLQHSEMEFIMPGPGALDGIAKCFSSLGGLSESELIKFVADRQESEFDRLGLRFETLFGRRLQLIDCQNLFCEVDKYARVVHPEVAGKTGRTRIKQIFRPTGPIDPPWYPPKWGINDKVHAILGAPHPGQDVKEGSQ